MNAIIFKERIKRNSKGLLMTKETDRQTDRQTTKRQQPCHDLSLKGEFFDGKNL